MRLTSIAHHVGLQVGDLDASIRFYVDALGGQVLTLPTVLEGPGIAVSMDAPAGTRMRHADVGFQGGAIELFQFVGDVMPEWAREPPRGRLPHFALFVDDVFARLNAVEQAGGRRLWPAVGDWGDAHNIYVADLDGNVVELIDASIEQIVATHLQMRPERDPRRVHETTRRARIDG